MVILGGLPSLDRKYKLYVTKKREKLLAKLGSDRLQETSLFVYIIVVAHAHALNAPLEWFWSTPGLAVV